MTWEGLNPPYRTIVADPPWRYDEGFSTRSRSPSRGWQGPVTRYRLPYSGLGIEAICALPVGQLADSDARLFLWTTNRYLPDAFGVAERVGVSFSSDDYLAQAVLSGSIAPNSEFLLVAVKGSPARLGRLASSVVSHAQSKTHSTKPPEFSDLIEQVSPGPYVELFARQPRLGWDHWGLGYELSPSLT